MERVEPAFRPVFSTGALGGAAFAKGGVVLQCKAEALRFNGTRRRKNFGSGGSVGLRQGAMENRNNDSVCYPFVGIALIGRQFIAELP